jgi:hypothetical protein
VYVFPNPNGGPFSKTTSRVTFINSAKELYFQQQREAWLKMNGETRKPLKNKFPYFEDLQFLGDLRGNIRRDDVNLTMDWQYFFDFGEDSDVLPQSSLAIDHHIADSLYDLFFFTRNREKSLPKRDFNSSRQLPSGHSIHLAMALANPDDPALHQLLTTHEVQYNGRTYKGVREVMGIDELRVEDLSLGHYVLLEAEIQHDGKQLGALGSRIVAEQIIWVLLADDTSILHQHNWQPDPHFIQWRNQGLGGLLNTPNTAPLPEEAQKFSIVDLLQYITAG